MPELTLSGTVGAPPAQNQPNDVRIVQEALQSFKPPLSTTVGVNGICDATLIKAIKEFQKRFMSSPDGRIEPGGRSLMHLSDGFAPTYVGCSSKQRVVIDRVMIEAQRWLDTTNSVLGGALSEEVKRKVRNIFHFEAGTPADAGHYLFVRSQYILLRSSFDWSIPFQCEAGTNAFAAWVVGTDPTIHFASNYFAMPRREQISRLIHERAHTVFRVGHGGMTPGGEVSFGVAPDDANPYTRQQAFDNAYCWEYLATALQPDYSAAVWRAL